MASRARGCVRFSTICPPHSLTLRGRHGGLLRRLAALDICSLPPPSAGGSDKLLLFQNQCRERRQGDVGHDRSRAVLLGKNRAAIALAASSIDFRVAVEDLLPATLDRQRDGVAFPVDGGEIGDD